MKRAKITANSANIRITDITIHDKRNGPWRNPRRQLLRRHPEIKKVTGKELDSFFKSQSFPRQSFSQYLLMAVHIIFPAQVAMISF